MAKLPVEKLKAKKSSKPIPVKIVNDAPSSTSIAKEDMKWRAESDLSTLQRAKEIEADKARFKAAKSYAKEQKAALEKICK
jgi:hypothetical protein